MGGAQVFMVGGQQEEVIDNQVRETMTMMMTVTTTIMVMMMIRMTIIQW